MKKLTAVIITFLMAINLTACSTSSASKSNLSDISSDVSDHASEKSSLSADFLSPENSEDPTNSKISSEPDLFPLENITMPDGSVVSKYEGKYAGPDYLYFDYSFIRYAQPICYSTFDDPDLVDWETNRFKTEPNKPIENPNYFKVKAGDKLQNGLTVRSAKYSVYENGAVSISLIEFDGELTLTGILYCYPEDTPLNSSSGDLSFFADPREYNYLPVSIVSDYSEVTEPWLDEKNKIAWISDKVSFDLGNIDDISVDLSEIITLGGYAKVKITLKDIEKGWSDNGAWSRAVIVAVEPLA